MGYSYDRRGDDAAAAKRPPPKMGPVPWREQEEVVKHLVAAHYVVQEWVIRSNMALRTEEEKHGFPGQFKSTRKEYEALAKLRDELDAVTDKFRSFKGGE